MTHGAFPGQRKSNDGRRGSKILLPVDNGVRLSPDAPAILTFIEHQEIRHLVHLTRIDNITSIAESGALLSRFVARTDGVKLFTNSVNMTTRMQNYISCSIEYPNNYLLQHFANRHVRQDWIALLIDPRIMAGMGVKFCPVNAAKIGAVAETGIDGLRRLYVNQPELSSWRRSPRHWRASPTDIQAEVLVPGRIFLSSIQMIITKSEQDRDEVDLYLNRSGLADSPRVEVFPKLFDIAYVRAKVTG